jgi:predicted nucleic acid-binding protein
MKPETLVDTSGFYALLVKRDDKHAEAGAFLRKAARRGGRFVTTDYVLDETATLLKARRLAHLVPSFFDVVFASGACRVEWTDAERFQRAWRFFVKHLDQPWSFTDCCSFCLMRELRLSRALTKDRHFRDVGFEPLLAGTDR